MLANSDSVNSQDTMREVKKINSREDVVNDPAALSPALFEQYKLVGSNGVNYKVYPANMESLKSRAAVRCLMEVWNELPTLFVGAIPSK